MHVDFTYWGYAVTKVPGVGGVAFLQSYFTNQDTPNEEALSSQPIAAVIVFIRNSSTWSASVSEPLREPKAVAERERINTNMKSWAKDA
ncbi:hypothetical protein AABM34_20290 [Lysinibacillus fusiformis]